MLIEFRVENHRSLRDEQVLTMEASKGPAADDSRPRVIEGVSESLLPTAVVYGANASGKSNVLLALAFMRMAVVNSHRFWPPEGGVPREPFGWGPAKEKTSFFEATFVSRGVKYQYGFEASDARFQEEWLYAWPKGKKQTWYERDQDGFEFGDSFRGENRLISDVTRPNALFLSAAAQHKHPMLGPVHSWFRWIGAAHSMAGLTGRMYGQGPPISLELILLSESFSDSPSFFDFEGRSDFEDRFRQMLRDADVGIVDFRVVKSEDPDKRLRREAKLQFKHKSSFEDSWLPFKEESKGTQALLKMIPPVWHSLQHGTLLVFDELEASLHPKLGYEIVKLFNDPKSNPRNAQLLFSTHDTNLIGTTMGEPAMRRDQVWLVEKDEEGATELYPLTDYKPRKPENLERGYLQGRYGAIPFLGNFDFKVESTNESPEGPTP